MRNLHNTPLYAWLPWKYLLYIKKSQQKALPINVIFITQTITQCIVFISKKATLQCKFDHTYSCIRAENFVPIKTQFQFFFFQWNTHVADSKSLAVRGNLNAESTGRKEQNSELGDYFHCAVIVLLAWMLCLLEGPCRNVIRFK